MSMVLRVTLFVTSICLFLFVCRKLRKSQLQLMDALFWLFFATVILLLGVFPSVGDVLARLTGVATTANFIFLATIFLLIIRSFLLSIKVSILEHKLTSLVQEIAIRDYKKNEGDNVDG